MLRNVLIVDDDRIWLKAIKKQFESYAEIFSTLTAGDGEEALEVLKSRMISLVVTDLQMPGMDGLTLLAKLSENYPDIPVIIMTAYSTPSSKKRVLDGGAAGYIEKPFVVEDLAEKIKTMLGKQSEGGTLQTVPLDMFIQLIEMEQKTCTIRVHNKKSKDVGVLFFRDGNLMEARYRSQQGKEAAYRIFGWDNVSLSIQDECPLKEKRIEGELQAILFDAARLRDEAGGIDPEPETDEDIEEIELLPAETEPMEPTGVEAVREKYREASADLKGLQDIAVDNGSRRYLSTLDRLGAFFRAGALKVCYLKSNIGAGGQILLPGEEVLSITVDDGFPRDQVLEVLSSD